jgi:hypothetical protein
MPKANHFAKYNLELGGQAELLVRGMTSSAFTASHAGIPFKLRQVPSYIIASMAINRSTAA